MVKRHSKPVRVTRKKRRVSVDKYAEILRGRMTTAEILLWKKLQVVQKHWNLVFESQGVVASRYVADFVCRSRMLIIELDGSVHALRSVRRKDKYRTMILERLGYRILRFNNIEVFKNCEKVLREIRNLL